MFDDSNFDTADAAGINDPLGVKATTVFKNDSVSFGGGIAKIESDTLKTWFIVVGVVLVSCLVKSLFA